MKMLFVTGVMTLIASHAFAQTPDSIPPSARSTAAVETGLAHTDGARGECRHGQLHLSRARCPEHLDTGRQVRGRIHRHAVAQQAPALVCPGPTAGHLGNAAYDGWCSPFLITPSGASPNGYELDVGNASPCSETGDKDWYLEARALAGKDLIGQRWAWSPYTGLGLRHLSNGTSGIPGYRTDDYLYLPVGMTARTQRGFAWGAELQPGIRSPDPRLAKDARFGFGWRRCSSDDDGACVHGRWLYGYLVLSVWRMGTACKCEISGDQALVAGAVHVRWNVSSSPVNYETATFTVNNVTAREQLGAYEPFNVTNEFGVRLGFHF